MAVSKKAAQPKRKTAKLTSKKRPKTLSKSSKAKTAAKQKRKKVVTLTPYALQVLDEIEAKREVLSNCVARGFLADEAVATRRYVLAYFTRHIREKGCRTRHDLRKPAYALGKRASTLQAKTKLPTAAGNPRARRRWMAQYNERRDAASAACTHYIYARKLYQEIALEELPSRKLLKPLSAPQALAA